MLVVFVLYISVSAPKEILWNVERLGVFLNQIMAILIYFKIFFSCFPITSAFLADSSIYVLKVHKAEDFDKMHTQIFFCLFYGLDNVLDKSFKKCMFLCRELNQFILCSTNVYFCEAVAVKEEAVPSNLFSLYTSRLNSKTGLPCTGAIQSLNTTTRHIYIAFLAPHFQMLLLFYYICVLAHLKRMVGRWNIVGNPNYCLVRIVALMQYSLS